ncbi:MAG: radical SAM family heme chaperone HemW [Acidimicrobiales bacterium]
MAGPLPVGVAPPRSGAVPAQARAELGAAAFGVYVHVPFCVRRCGYCAFVTYTAAELGGGGHRAGFVASAQAELALAGRLLGRRPAETVFFGGGTPTLLTPGELAALLGAVEEHLGLAPDAEITVEANPDSVDAEGLAALRAAGFTRVSFGMQSVRPHVLAALDRTHAPGRAQEAAGEALAAGFEHVNLDLIYGAPGETDQDWLASLEAVIAAGVDHVSAYALSVEPGSKLAARVRRGAEGPDDDVEARRYEAADAALGAAGFGWYELSNWARTPAARCRHNLGYWRNANWWGVGPGAHSHVGGVRWWNAAHPGPWAARLAAGESPAVGREELTAAQRQVERILLGVRLAEGLPAAELPPAAVARACEEGLAETTGGRLVATLAGRRLADHLALLLVGG